MLLSATTARQAPEGAVRLLPADRRRRGADVRRGPHPRLVLPPRGPPERGRDPHLPADRPAAAPVVRQGPAQRGPGRRSRSWRWTPTTSTTWSRSTPRRCPPSSPACRSPARSAATRVALVEGQWVAFPTHSELETRHLRHGRRRPGPADERRRRDHDGRGRGHRAHARAGRRAARTAPTEEVVAGGPGGRQAVHPRRCARRRPSWPTWPPSRPPSSRSSPTTATTSSTPSRPRSADELAEALTIAGKQEREAELDRIKEPRVERARRPSSRAARRRSAARSGR